MNTSTRTANTLSLRDRVTVQCAVYDAIAQFPDQQDVIAIMQAQAMKDIQATAARTMQRTAPRLTVVQALTNSAAVRHDTARMDALQQAKNNLATANWIAQGNSALGRALQRLAMCDMNSLRAKTATAKQCSVMAEYSNLGKFWG